MDIGILVGSLRKDSYNMKVARYIKDRYKDLAKFTIVDIGGLTLFNEDLEENLPPAVVELRKEVDQQDGMIFITPEYNYSLSGVLKNALDWLSRDTFPLMKKPYMSMGASSGSIGTTRAQSDLRRILNSGAFKMYSMAGNEFLFANIQDNMDDQGRISNEGTVKRLDRTMEEFLDFVKLIKNK